jgi:hypothetical protein
VHYRDGVMSVVEGACPSKHSNCCNVVLHMIQENTEDWHAVMIRSKSDVVTGNVTSLVVSVISQLSN